MARFQLQGAVYLSTVPLSCIYELGYIYLSCTFFAYKFQFNATNKTCSFFNGIVDSTWHWFLYINATDRGMTWELNRKWNYEANFWQQKYINISIRRPRLLIRTVNTHYKLLIKFTYLSKFRTIQPPICVGKWVS